MAETLGTIRGQMILDVKQTLAAYTSARQANISTVTALHTGAGALIASGAAMAGVGTIMAAGLLTAVGAAAEFEKKLDYFGAISASTQAEYDAIREKALQLGTDTVYSANEIADSFVELGKAGVGANDIINGIGEAVANLGSAADIPLDTAAVIIMSAVQTFGLSADSAVGVADKLAGAANASIISVEDIGTSLKYAGGVAASLGIPFEDVNTAIALLGQYGIRGSTAGTSLRKMMLSLGGATPKATAALKDLGIITEDGANKFYDAEGSAKPLADIFQTLQEATSGLTDKQKVSALNTIFQNRALASAIGLTTEGAAGFEKMAEAIDKTTAMEVAGKRLDNLSGDLEVLQGNIDTLMITTGSSFQEFARTVIQAVTGIVQAFIDMPAGLQQAILIFMGITGILLILVGTFGMFAGAVLNMIALGIQLAPVFVAIGKAIGIARTAVQLFGLAMTTALGPVGIIITVIALLVGALVWFFTQTEVGKNAWSSFMGFLGEAWANISSTATKVFTDMGTFFSDTWANIVGFFTGAIDFIMGLFFTFHPLGIIIANWGAIVSFFTTLWTNVTTGITNFITGALSFFQALPGNILAFFMALPGMIGYALGFLLGTIVRVFIAIGVWLFTELPLIINNVVTWFAELPGKVGAFLAQLYTDAVLWFTTMGVNIILKVIEMYNGIIQWFQQLPAQVAAFFLDLVARAINTFTSLRDRILIIAANIMLGIINFFRQLPANVARIFNDVVTSITTTFAGALATAIRIASDIKNGIVNGIQGIPGLVTGIFNNVISAIKGVITSAANAVKDFAAGMWEGFKDGLGIHSPSYIEHAMWAITGVVADETDNLKKQVKVIQGLGNGISEVGNNLGVGFGNNFTGDLTSLYSQMSSGKALELQVMNGSMLGSANNQNNQAFETPTVVNNTTTTNQDFTVNNQENPTAWARAVGRELRIG